MSINLALYSFFRFNPCKGLGSVPISGDFRSTQCENQFQSLTGIGVGSDTAYTGAKASGATVSIPVRVWGRFRSYSITPQLLGVLVSIPVRVWGRFR